MGRKNRKLNSRAEGSRVSGPAARRRGWPWPFVAVSVAVLLSGCSPAYVYKSAAGHAKLLWNRRPIDDPRAPEPLKAKLRLVAEVRAFAFEEMGLARSRDYATYTPVSGPVTFLVSASSKTAFAAYHWSFPLIGRFPYKGYFERRDALREKERLEARGYDAALSGAAAYNTPLWITDPLPSSALDHEPGELAALLLHELAHGTLPFRSDMRFEESLASFIGERGAADFLAQRFGADSAELAAYRRALEGERAFAAALEEVHDRLDALYRGPASEPEKLARREELMAWGRGRLERAGRPLPELNNAVILSRRLYQEGRERFESAHEAHGGDWKRTLAFFKSLDRRRPEEDLKARSPGSRRAD